MVIRSRWNMRQRWLHSKEAYAPDGSAAHSNPGCPQVWLGVWWDGWGVDMVTRDVTEVKRHMTNWSSVCVVKHNWETMKEAINNYIGSLNWGYRVALRDKKVDYVNAYAEFMDPHKIKVSHCENRYKQEVFYIKQQSLRHRCFTCGIHLNLLTYRQQTSEGRRCFTRQQGLSWPQVRGHVTWTSLETRSTVSPGENATDSDCSRSILHCVCRRISIDWSVVAALLENLVIKGNFRECYKVHEHAL